MSSEHKMLKNILVLGDSHARVYFSSKNPEGKIKPKDKNMNLVQSEFHFDVYSVSGATAQGAVNPNSKTKALSKFKNKLHNIKPIAYDYIAIMLGEVDCGFVIWYRSEKHSIPVEEQLELTIKNLFCFIKKEVVTVFDASKIIVIGSVLPTIKDGEKNSEVANLRDEVKATQLERTNLTLKYNERLKEISTKLGFKYVDITEETINVDSNLIDDKYINSKKNDHHLPFDKIWKFWLNKLKKILI